ncbi:MAG: hypothetical protein ACI4UB_04650 [Limosilactobacillus sp.]
MNIFIISAALALLLLIIQFIRQVRRTKKGNTEISRGAICFNWLLLLVFLVGVGGAIYTGVNTHRQAKPARPVKATSSSTSSQAEQAIKLDFTSDVTMEDNGQVNIKITVSRGTTVTIKGRNTGHVYQNFTVARGRGTTTKVISLDSAEPYQVVAKRNGKQVAKDLTVRQARATAISSAPTAVSQSSVSRAASVNNANTTGTSSVRQSGASPAVATSSPVTTNTSSQENNQ